MDSLVEACRRVKMQRKFLPCRISFDSFEVIDKYNANLLDARLEIFGQVGKQTGKPSPIAKTEAEAVDIDFI